MDRESHYSVGGNLKGLFTGFLYGLTLGIPTMRHLASQKRLYGRAGRVPVPNLGNIVGATAGFLTFTLGVWEIAEHPDLIKDVFSNGDIKDVLTTLELPHRPSALIKDLTIPAGFIFARSLHDYWHRVDQSYFEKRNSRNR